MAVNGHQTASIYRLSQQLINRVKSASIYTLSNDDKVLLVQEIDATLELLDKKMIKLEESIQALDLKPEFRVLEEKSTQSMRKDWRELDRLKQALSGCKDSLEGRNSR